MPITTSMNTFIARAGGKIEVPKLPNHLIMDIIKLADGGRLTHRSKMKPITEAINFLRYDFGMPVKVRVRSVRPECMRVIQVNRKTS